MNAQCWCRGFAGLLFSLITLSALAPFGIAQEGGEKVSVERVIPNKILYALNENASALVWLKNTSPQAQAGTLVAAELRDLSEAHEVAWLDLLLEPDQERKDISISWNVGPEMYGRELRVEFVKEGNVISSASEFFGVADDWLRVNINGGWGPKEMGD